MLSSKRVKGIWWACAALAVLLAAGCVSAASEESGGDVPASVAEGRAAPVEPSLVDGEPDGVEPGVAIAGGVSAGSGDASSVSSTSSSLLDGASIFGSEGEDEISEEMLRALLYDRPDWSGYSDEWVVASAFHHRALLVDDPWGVDLNDLFYIVGGIVLDSFECVYDSANCGV